MTASTNSQQSPILDLLKRLGFSQVSDQHSKRRRLIFGGEGLPATGKTRFIRTCPPPIAVLDFDKGMEDVCEYAEYDGSPIFRKSIQMADFDEKAPIVDKNGATSIAVSKTELQIAKDSYAEYKNSIELILKSGAVRTLAIDNAGNAYSLAMAARFGQMARLGDVPGQYWRLMNTEFMEIHKMAFDYNVNLIVLHRQKRKFKGMLGELELDGYQGMPGELQVHVAFEKKVLAAIPKSATHPGQEADVQLLARVLKCRQRFALEGQIFPVIWLDEEKTQSVGFDFLTIATSVFPNSQQSDWF